MREKHILHTSYFTLQMFTPFNVIGCSLELLRIGERGIVTFCKVHDERIYKKIISIGVKTGTIITLEQQFPTLLIGIGNLSFDIEREVARTIYVRIIDN
ncbi:ferrous iron transport protein A [Dendronalium sp. ChiSLP03b]|uniref:ferrous iron transport protein A n=1 Tax=Dendronalium sp. ChiSLP03b TaxID=3075381 RepID=UPI002AD28E7C|nr:ferrous iron transport protein A [Dendronalium sp. ChiSLP03b]